MYPDPDSRAEQFDDALERRQDGNGPPADDQELQELVQLASRLEQQLPEDTPDPAFRDSLKQQLLSGEYPVAEPVDLAAEGWRQRLSRSSWRVGAAAAAVAVVAVVAVVIGMDPLGEGDTIESSDSASFQALDQGGTDQTGDSPSGLSGLTGDNQNWFAASFPPLDAEHLVLPPFLAQYLSSSDEPEPESQVELNGVSEVVADTEMPQSAPVLYLSAPSDAETMLTTLRSTLDIDGEIRPGTQSGQPYQVVNQNQEPVITWDPGAAHFHFRGELLSDPVTVPASDDTDPADIAVRFLERIGFDLTTIQYERRVNDLGDAAEVEIRPANFPEMGLDLSLGGRVVVDGDGAIREAELFWLSLIDRRSATLRDPDEILRDIEEGDGYAPPVPDTDSDEQMRMDVAEAGLTHVLTRMDEGSFILQPAMTLSGEFDGASTDEFPAAAQFVVPAVENGD